MLKENELMFEAIEAYHEGFPVGPDGSVEIEVDESIALAYLESYTSTVPEQLGLFGDWTAADIPEFIFGTYKITPSGFKSFEPYLWN